MTDFEGRVALTVVPDFGAFAVYRRPDNKVMLNLRLFPASTNLFSDELVMVRFDKHPAHTFTRPTKAQVNAPVWNYDARSMEIEVWHGNTARGTNAFINQLMTSSEALVRYRLYLGGYKDVKVRLDGAGAVVAQALSLPVPAQAQGLPARPPAAAEPEPAYNTTAWSTAMRRCMDGPETRVCISKLMNCFSEVQGQDELLLACTQR